MLEVEPTNFYSCVPLLRSRIEKFKKKGQLLISCWEVNKYRVIYPFFLFKLDRFLLCFYKNSVTNSVSVSVFNIEPFFLQSPFRMETLGVSHDETFLISQNEKEGLLRVWRHSNIHIQEVRKNANLPYQFTLTVLDSKGRQRDI